MIDFVPGVQIDRSDDDGSTHCCLVAIGRLQVTSTLNANDLGGSNSNNGIKNCYALHSSILVLSYSKTGSYSLSLSLSPLFQNLYLAIQWMASSRLSISEL